MKSDSPDSWQDMSMTKNKRDEFLVSIRKKKNDSLIKQNRHKMYHINEEGKSATENCKLDQNFQDEDIFGRTAQNGLEDQDIENITLSPEVSLSCPSFLTIICLESRTIKSDPWKILSSFQ